MAHERQHSAAMSPLGCIFRLSEARRPRLAKMFERSLHFGPAVNRSRPRVAHGSIRGDGLGGGIRLDRSKT